MIANLNIPTSVPLLYQLEEQANGDLKPVKQEQAYAPMSGRYLGDQEAIKAAIEGVANQAGKK